MLVNSNGDKRSEGIWLMAELEITTIL